MSIHIARYLERGEPRWATVHGAELLPLAGRFASLAELLAARERDADALVPDRSAAPVDAESVELLSPVTPPTQILCQGQNYRAHRRESGADPDRSPFNLLFAKATSSLAPPRGAIVRPAGVQLLDYELELGLVIRRPITGAIRIDEGNLPEYVAGLVMANDVSARDVQIPQGQWWKGKSYRTFCPTGPYLYLLDRDDGPRVRRLELRLSVEGKLRQNASTADLIHGPVETLRELASMVDLFPGDLILTGTPGGVALRAPGPLVQRASAMLGDELRMRLFISREARRGGYLRDGDTLTSTISGNGVDLGEQRLRVQGVAAETAAPEPRRGAAEGRSVLHG
jgi:2-keto-4-pentenoate hydratase/2-oxohepta-3-ene-1,7-dioic acid hydratase in catechol pathway